MCEESILSGFRQPCLNFCCIGLLNMSCKIHQDSIPPSDIYSILFPSPSRARRAWSSFTKSRWAFSLLERNANSTRAFYLEWLIYRIGARNLNARSICLCFNLHKSARVRICCLLAAAQVVLAVLLSSISASCSASFCHRTVSLPIKQG